MKKQLIIFLLATHLVLIYMAGNLFRIDWLPIRIQAPFLLYFAGSGATGYGYFAVDINTQPVAKCYILDADGSLRAEVFGTEDGPYDFKAGLPFEGLFSQKAHEVAARMAAANCYKLHPGARLVKVLLGQYHVPSVGEYNKGKQCGFSEYYSAIYCNE